MGDDIQVIDYLCGPGARSVPRNSVVPEIAQLYALGLYRSWFRSQHPIGEVLSEWDLVGKVSVGTGIKGPDLALKYIKSDFRNYYSKSQRNRMLIRQGTPASGLREGRSIRADGLGLAVDPIARAIIAELIEISTADEAEATMAEDLQPKLALLRGPIKTLVERELKEIHDNVSSALPEKFQASGSPFLIPAALCAVPIFGDYAASTGTQAQYKWICFGPTFRYRPFPLGSFAQLEPEASPARGLLLYSYHEMNNPQSVPNEVVLRFRDWAAKQQRRYQRLELLPTPEVTQYWRDNDDDLKKIAAYAALVTIAVAAVVVAVYLAPIIAEVAVATLARMAALATTEALATQASALIALISSSVPPIMNFSRTAIQAATEIGPKFAFATN